MTDYTPTQIKAIDLFASALKRNDKAAAAVAAVQTEAQEASDELQWIAAHPALRGIDLAQVAADIRAGDDNKAAEPTKPAEAEEAKPKRKRRTKAQIEADKAAEEAAKNGGVAAPVSETDASVAPGDGANDDGQDDDTFSEAAPANVTQFPTQAAPPAPAPTFAPPAPPADNGSGFLNPFAQG